MRQRIYYSRWLVHDNIQRHGPTPRISKSAALHCVLFRHQNRRAVRELQVWPTQYGMIGKCMLPDLQTQIAQRIEKRSGIANSGNGVNRLTYEGTEWTLFAGDQRSRGHEECAHR
jgi:hypothetical protein